MDYISDMLIRIKNANSAYKPEVSLPYSSLGLAVAETLFKAGFVGAPQRKGKKYNASQKTFGKNYSLNRQPIAW